MINRMNVMLKNKNQISKKYNVISCPDTHKKKYDSMREAVIWMKYQKSYAFMHKKLSSHFKRIPNNFIKS